MKKLVIYILTAVFASTLVTSCFSGKRSASSGGEVTGIGAYTTTESTPYGMVLVDCGSMKEGPSSRDSLWGIDSVSRGISVDAFWIDETEISNSKYKQFVYFFYCK